jgi:O-methyltransferase
MPPLAAKLNLALRQLGVELYRDDPQALGYGTTDSQTIRDRALLLLARFGYGVRRTYPADLPAEVAATLESVRPHTMTSALTVIGLCEAVEYLVRSRLPGSIVECGVWRGGSMMAVALTLLRLGVEDRDLYLFDTFAGMAMPSEHDFPFGEPDRPALARWRRDRRGEVNEWAYAPLERVRDNILSTGYPPQRVHLVKGLVQDTVPDQAPDAIALLRLDTDWYESTRHELKHLYPRLTPGGVLILDDYGAWAGQRRAVDEFAPASGLLLSRIGASARLAVKP